MGEKKVTKIAGIGPVYGGRLEEKGIDKAYVMLGYLLLLKKDKEMFVEWIQRACGACTRYSKECYNCLIEWCNHFLY